MCVGGEYVPSSSRKVFEAENAASREVTAHTFERDKEDIDNAVRVVAPVTAYTYLFINEPWSSSGGSSLYELMLSAGRLI